MAITAALVKELREKTGAGMMDAKKALTETDGDMDAAVDWLRTKGLAKAAKKSGRTAAEGLPIAFTEPVTDHAASDDCGVAILGAGSDGNRLGANFIGPAAVGSSQELGNGEAGVYVYNGPQNTQIGGSGGDLSGNVIAFNNRGVLVDANFTASMNNAIRGNSIHRNALQQPF